jgi:hypothetical protein
MLLVVQCWRGPDLRSFAESRDDPDIAAIGDSLGRIEGESAGRFRRIADTAGGKRHLQGAWPLGA